MRPVTLARLRDLGHQTYESYLKSRHWARVRHLYRSSRPWVCLCGEHDRLQLHHKTYVRIGAERLDDLQPLCDRCHSLVHQLEREGLLEIDLDGFFDIRRVLLNRIERETREQKAASEFTGQRTHGLEKVSRRAEQDRRRREHVDGLVLTKKQRRAIFRAIDAKRDEREAQQQFQQRRPKS